MDNHIGAERLVERLTNLGFTKYEALAYMLLLDEHPATAYEISKRGGLTKGNVYTALASLVQKDAVQPVSTDPVRYAPMDPEVVLNRIAKSTSVLCSELARSLSRRHRQKPVDYVWTVTGERRLREKIDEMIYGARRQIWIKAPHHLLEDHAAALRRASARGASILIILFGSMTDAERLGLGRDAKVYLHEGSGDMLAIGRRQFVIAADWTETLIADFDGEPHGAYTRSLPVVFMAETMIRHEVYLAEIISEYGAAIERRFGKDLVTLRRKYLPPDLFREVEKRSGPSRPRVRASASRTDTQATLVRKAS